ncbi:gamma-glutamylcyclotransferase family protein [Streptomyces sp. CC219B]|uniref:gamma-glutamylcyclotransferase family protein n=1 Tax=Streptomyces sp. CC219B TaxID=3044574 RepID=UPI0024A8E052|nr:gamma-glutamylcyclotransferase family protein [Streptomyces sp. CC219B]
MTLPFFVYGTLRPGEPNYDLFLRGHTLREEPARLPRALLYDGPGYPYLVEEGEQEAAVHGDLVTARPEAYAQLLAVLDRLEEYTPGDPRNLYERVAREVTRGADGTAVRAWVYVAAPPVAARLRVRGRIIRGGDWTARRQESPPPPAAPHTT